MSSSERGVVRVDRVWKRFRPDRQRNLLRDEIQRFRQRRAGQRNPWTWALRDVSFEMEPGSAFALVGSNGSGKSTMLKILTRVMYPYAGKVAVEGRVGALIEVAGGIHPDLSGRENCYLYGSLLGLSRADVSHRFDEIVAFAELEQAIDRQVKFYSSGMKMRLGFGVAAFLEPDVLLVDEVLAVGDAQFQQRCLNRMRVVLAQGTTLVYVSHDLATVESMCAHGVWLRNGVIETLGPVSDVLRDYRTWIEQRADDDAATGSGPIRLVKAEVTGDGDDAPRTAGPVTVALVFESDVETDAVVHLGLSQGPATPIVTARQDMHLEVGTTRVRCTIEHVPLAGGRYAAWAAVLDENGRDLVEWSPATTFDLVGPDLLQAPRGVVRLAPVYAPVSWDITDDA